MPTETMALLMAYLMEGTRDHLQFHEFGRQQPRAKLLSKLLFGIKRAKRAIAEGWVLKCGSRDAYSLGEDSFLEETVTRGRSSANVAANAVSNECIIRINQEICRMQELMTKAKQKTLPNFVKA